MRKISIKSTVITPFTLNESEDVKMRDVEKQDITNVDPVEEPYGFQLPEEEDEAMEKMVEKERKEKEKYLKDAIETVDQINDAKTPACPKPGKDLTERFYLNEAEDEEEMSMEDEEELPVEDEPLDDDETYDDSIDVDDGEVDQLLSTFKPHDGAVDTWKKIQDAGAEKELANLLKDSFKGVDASQLNDLLWFEGEFFLSKLGIESEEELDNDDDEVEGDE